VCCAEGKVAWHCVIVKLVTYRLCVVLSQLRAVGRIGGNVAGFLCTYPLFAWIFIVHLRRVEECCGRETRPSVKFIVWLLHLVRFS